MEINMSISRSQIEKIWKKISNNSISDKELAIFNEWRYYHNNIISNVQRSIKKRLKKLWINNINIVQRLKRMSSIKYKISRLQTRLSAMQDIWGIRIIVNDIPTVYKIRDIIVGLLKHDLQNENDYIRNVKNDWYRSFHLIYQYKSKIQKYNWLFFEIQVRSQLQHIWATTVEIIDTVERINIKWWGSSNKENNRRKFFVYISNLIYYLDMNDTENLESQIIKIGEYIDQINYIIKINRKLSLIKQNTIDPFRFLIKRKRWKTRTIYRNSKYIIFTYDTKEKIKKIYSFPTEEKAKAKYFEIETNFPTIDAVLVSWTNYENLEKAYPNYLLNLNKFVKVLDVFMENI